jgi:hypothetical protein
LDFGSILLPSKGLHQEEGKQVLAENHVTLEIAELPNPKRFHMFFWYVTVNKETGLAPQLRDVYQGKQHRHSKPLSDDRDDRRPLPSRRRVFAGDRVVAS